MANRRIYANQHQGDEGGDGRRVECAWWSRQEACVSPVTLRVRANDHSRSTLIPPLDGASDR